MPDLLNVTNVSAPAQVTVPVGASSINNSAVLTVAWRPCADTTTALVVAKPWVTVAMPAVVNVTLAADQDVIYPASDPLASLDGVPSNATFTVVVTFEDGSQRNMEGDSRTTFSASSPVIVFENQNVAVVGNNWNNEAQAERGVVAVVTVSFGNFSDLTASMVLAVAATQAVSLSAAAHPPCTAVTCTARTDLYPIQTTSTSGGGGGDYQRLRLTASAVDSFGNIFEVPLDESVAVTWNDTGVVTGTSGGCHQPQVLGQCTVNDGSFFAGVVVGVAPGRAAVTLLWASTTKNFSAMLELTVHAEAATVTLSLIHI